MERIDILSMFTHLSPDTNDIQKMNIIRDKMQDVALTIFDFCPDSPQRDYSIQLLHMSNMTANVAVLRNHSLLQRANT